MIKAEMAKLKENKKAQADEIEDRDLENVAYQSNIKNLANSQKLLAKSMKVLKEFYDSKKQALIAKKGKVSKKTANTTEVQKTANATEAKANAISATKKANKTSATKHAALNTTKKAAMVVKKGKVTKGKKGDQEPPATFDDLSGEFEGQSGQATDVLSMLSFILDETKKEEKQAHVTEEGAQHAFEDMMNDLKSQERETTETIVDYQDELAEKEKSLEEDKMDHLRVANEKKAIEKYLLSIKGECDFIMANIDKRRESREAEEKSLENAKDQLYSTPAYKAAKAKDEAAKANAKK